LFCDWCGKEPMWMGKPADRFVYTAHLKFVQCEVHYELCSRDCMFKAINKQTDNKI
jgi:hypothetical protein